MERPERVLIATVGDQERLRGIREWAASLAAQDAPCLWDVLLLDGTPDPHEFWIGGLNHWARRANLGPGHRARVARFGRTEDGRVFAGREWSDAHGWGLAWEKFARWQSYDHLWLVSPGHRPAPRDLRAFLSDERFWQGSDEPSFTSTFVRGEAVRSVPYRMSDTPQQTMRTAVLEWASQPRATMG